MARLPNTATKAQRQELHVAKMEGIRYNLENLPRPPIYIRTRADVRRYTGSIALFNRHTGKAHEHAREIMRRTMTPIQRRAFRTALALNMAAQAAA